MTWRGTVTVPDRLWAAMPYILPIASSISYAGAFIQLAPITTPVILPLAMMGLTYNRIVGLLGNFGPLLIFFALFAFVVRNPKIPHFIRYNTMLAMMIDIMLTLVSLVFQAVNLSVQMVTLQAASDPFGVVVLIFFAGVFITAAAAYGYSLFNVAQGKYAEIKWVSEAAYAQTQV
jgi:Chloroplast import apparatus Tic20-like